MFFLFWVSSSLSSIYVRSSIDFKDSLEKETMFLCVLSRGIYFYVSPNWWTATCNLISRWMNIEIVFCWYYSLLMAAHSLATLQLQTQRVLTWNHFCFVLALRNKKVWQVYRLMCEDFGYDRFKILSAEPNKGILVLNFFTLFLFFISHQGNRSCFAE